MRKLNLSTLGKVELDRVSLNIIRGSQRDSAVCVGDFFYCGCKYANEGGSSTKANSRANEQVSVDNAGTDN